MPPEVVVTGQYNGTATYSAASDIYMLGTVIWEIYWIKEKGPITDNQRHFAPFCHVPKDQVHNARESRRNLYQDRDFAMLECGR
jgi:hypothetical protein